MGYTGAGEISVPELPPWRSSISRVWVWISVRLPKENKWNEQRKGLRRKP